MTVTYQPRLLSRSEFITIRGLRYHVRQWGPQGAPKLFLVHGWMDVSASFQFLADALHSERHLIAPDWRGYGLSEWPTRHPGVDCYWFPDYLADLDALVEHYQAETPIDLLGHSMGGNVALMYAGIRAERVRRLVNLEGFGMPDTVPQQAPSRYRRWLDALREGESMRRYASLDEVVCRLQKNNPRLTDARAAFVARHWAQAGADGCFRVLGDPAHKLINPVLYRLAEAQACWKKIRAPVLHIEAQGTDAHRWLANGDSDFSMEAFRTRFDVIADRREAFVADAGHMLHHDQPEQLAALIEPFLQ